MYIVKDLRKADHHNIKVGVFRVNEGSEEQIGEYERSIYTKATTFFAFQQDGKDFALYSPHYSQIKIMDLPTCRDIGGEESSPDDFCSIDFYVPSYMEREITSRTTNSQGEVEEKTWTSRVTEPKEEELFEYTKSSTYKNTNTNETESSETIYRPLTSRLYYPFGFVYGCRWADDSTIHFLDLAEVENGIIKREARFGYIDIPSNLSLKEAVDMRIYDSYFDYGNNQIQIHIMQTFDLNSGERIIETYE